MLITREMRRQDLTLDQVARRSGLAIATIAALRAGTRGKRPRPATIARLAAGLGLSPDVIAEATGASEPLTDGSREAELINVFRQLDPSDQALAERIIREIARTSRRSQHRDGPDDAHSQGGDGVGPS
jgi:transcriptional regulator with XRE-family HTH domain